MQGITIRSRRLTACAAAAVLAAASLAGGAFPLTASADGAPEYAYRLLAGGDQIGMEIIVTASGAVTDLTLDTGSPAESQVNMTDTGFSLILPVNAAELTKPHTLTFKVGGQTQTKSGITAAGYLNDLLADTQYASYAGVAQAMLDYGYAAETYFSGAAASPEAYGMTAAPDFSGVTVSESKFTGKDAYNADLETKDLPYRYYGMNLTLLDQIRFSLYFETDGEAGEYYLTDGSFGSDDPINKEKITDDYTRIWITVPASKLTETFTCVHPPADPVDFSPAQYIAAAAAGEDAALADVCKALYAYGKAAKNTSSVEPQDPEKWESEEAHSGKATFYDYGGAYPVGNALLDDFIEQNNMNIAALTDDDYHKYVGGYIKVKRGEKSVCALVGDIMPFADNPNAQAGDVDLNEAAFPEIADKAEGKVDITWQLIPLPTAAEAPVSYAVKEGSNKYWGGIQVRNTTYPVAKLEWSADGTNFTEIERMSDCYNYFVIQPDGKTNLTFRITDIFGQVVTDENVTLPLTGTDSTAVQLVSGSGVQFPK